MAIYQHKSVLKNPDEKALQKYASNINLDDDNLHKECLNHGTQKKLRQKGISAEKIQIQDKENS